MIITRSHEEGTCANSAVNLKGQFISTGAQHGQEQKLLHDTNFMEFAIIF